MAFCVLFIIDTQLRNNQFFILPVSKIKINKTTHGNYNRCAYYKTIHSINSDKNNIQDNICRQIIQRCPCHKTVFINTG